MDVYLIYYWGKAIMTRAQMKQASKDQLRGNWGWAICLTIFAWILIVGSGLEKILPTQSFAITMKQ